MTKWYVSDSQIMPRANERWRSKATHKYKQSIKKIYKTDRKEIMKFHVVTTNQGEQQTTTITNQQLNKKQVSGDLCLCLCLCRCSCDASFGEVQPNDLNGFSLNHLPASGAWTSSTDTLKTHLIHLFWPSCCFWSVQ